MRALFRSLAFRLGVAIAAIVIAAFFALVLAYQESIKVEFHEFVNVDPQAEVPEMAEFEEMARAISTAYTAGGWPRVLAGFPEGPLLLIAADGEVIEGAVGVGAMAEFSLLADQKYEISINLDGQGNSDIFLTGVPGTQLVTWEGAVFGYLFYIPMPGLPDRSSGFATSVSKTAAWFIIPIALLTLILVGLSVRIGLNPVHQVTKAAKTLQGGKIPDPITAKASGEVGDLVAAFNSAVEELGRTEDMRQNFISAVAHELRTPVTNLKGQLEALEAGLIKKDKAFLEVMKTETGLLEGLIGDLQDLATSDAGRLKIYPEALNLGRELAGAWKGFHGAKAAKFETLVASDLEVTADPRRLRQILLNLFSNAFNVRHRGLILNAEARIIGKMVEISIADNGPGIKPEDLSEIFQRFYRADRSRTRDTGGAGLGLSIVKTFVEAHGGKIKAENLAKGGARFIFSLPLSK